MKQIIITITFISMCFGGNNIANLFKDQIQNFPQEIQQQFSKKALSWKNIPGKPFNRSMMDPSDLLGEWEYVDENATLWVTSGTNQTIPNPAQAQGMEPADGAIGIDGPISGSMNYMMAMVVNMYGDEIVFANLSNNPIDEEDDYYYYEEDSFPENMTLPFYYLEYISFPAYGFSGGMFAIIDTADGDYVEYYYEFENTDDQITVDSTSLRINITDLTLTNDNGDSTYVLSGTLTPGTIDIEAGVPTEISSPMFEEDFGPVSGDESMTWQLHENGTGLEIIYGEDYYGPWFDTTELQWSATDDSITFIFMYYDDYYGYEESDTISLAYEVTDDMLSLSAEFDFCEMMGDDYYYYYYDSLNCYDMFEMQFGITDIQDITLDFWMEMSYSGPLAIAGEIGLQPGQFKLHQAYPNPFNPTTTLKYEMGSAGPVSINVFDVSGHKIRSLYNGIQIPGQHEVRWDAKNDNGRSMSSGVYLFKVNVNGKTHTAKTLLLK